MTNAPPLQTNLTPHDAAGIPCHGSSTSIPTSMPMSASGGCADQAITCNTECTRKAASCIDAFSTCKHQNNNNNNNNNRKGGKNRPQLASSSVQLHEPTTASSSSSSVQSPARILASDKDKDWLSPHLCVLRQSIEAFAATARDVEARRKQGGPTRNPPKVGHVGIRCIHCKHLPLKKRIKAAEAYPSSVKNVHQCVRNFQRNHWPGCTCVPLDVREAFDSVKSKHTQSKSKASEYWAESCVDLGMVDLPDGRGIVFSDGRAPTFAAADATANFDANADDDDDDDDDARAIVPSGGSTFTGADHDHHHHHYHQQDQHLSAGRPRINTMDTLDEAMEILAATPAQLPTILACAEDGGPRGHAIGPAPPMMGVVPATAGDAAEHIDVNVGENIMMSNSADAEVQIAEVPAMSLEEAMAAIAAGKSEGRQWENFATSVGDPAANHRRQLPSTLVSVREVVRHLRQKHEKSAVVSNTCTAGDDLHTLGLALYRSLAGENYCASCWEEHGADADDKNIDNDNGNSERLQKRERRPKDGGRGGEFALKDLGYPVSISIFVQSLIDATDGDASERFATLKDVEDDVERMIVDPDKYVFGQASLSISSNGSGGGQTMNISATTLYGREAQESKLLQAFESVMAASENSRGLALVSGRSGSGKTSLVEMALVNRLQQRRGRIVRVKFDNNDKSMLAIFRAFNQYCQDLWDDPELLAAVGASVKSALGPATSLLLNLMPSLYSIVGDVNFPSLLNLSNTERHNLLLHGFRSFVRSITAVSHPLVILFDDLQWVDPETLTLISELIMDTAMISCLFVVCYRSDEVIGDQILLDALGQLTSSATPTWQIHVDDITVEDINQLLSDSCLLSPRLTLPLSLEIHKKTQGSPMFVRQLLRSLCDEGVLHYSPSEGRWQWNIAAIRSMSVPDGAVGLVLERMSHYGFDIQRLLQIASLMGSRFTAASLTLFQAGCDYHVCSSSTAILNIIDQIVSDGLVCIDKEGELRFAHDSIWEAALSLTPTSERETMHLLIGRSLLMGCSRSHRPDDESLDVHLNLIVDQMNRGSALIVGTEDRLKLCELNMKAGKNALEMESFLEASVYLLQGTVLITEKDWSTPTSYSLCLDLFTSSAEAQLAHGRNDAAVISANAVISRGKCLDDTLASNFVAFVGLYNQGKLKEALSLSLDVLGRLQIDLPSQTAFIEQSEIRSQLEKTETMLATIRVEDVTSRAISTDKKTIYTMLFLYAVCKSAYVSRPDLMTIAIFRMIELIFSGETLTSESSFAFASYSNLLCTIGLRDRSARFARIAMALVDKFEGKYSGEIILSLSISIKPYTEPLQSILSLLETASLDSTSVGDLNTAFLCRAFGAAIMHIHSSFETLDVAEKKLQESLNELTAHGHPMFINSMIQLQGCLNLITLNAGPDVVDPTIIQGSATNDKEIMSVFPESHPFYGRLKRKADFMRLFLAILFRRQDVILEVAPRVKVHMSSSKFYPSTELLLEKFYLGVAAYSIVRQGGGNCDSEDWQAIGHELTNEMKTLSEHDSKWNFESKVFLLEAEKAFTQGELEEAALCYDKAIDSAKQHRFIGEQALSCERTALFYTENGSTGQARKYFETSQDLYEAWGAHRKVDDIRSLLADTGM